MFVWGFMYHSRIFHSRVTITGEGHQILTYTRHSWPLNSEGSLACHTYCDKGHPFLMIISHTCCRAFRSGAVTTCFYDSNTQLSAYEANAQPTTPPRQWFSLKFTFIADRIEFNYSLRTPLHTQSKYLFFFEVYLQKLSIYKYRYKYS